MAATSTEVTTAPSAAATVAQFTQGLLAELNQDVDGLLQKIKGNEEVTRLVIESLQAQIAAGDREIAKIPGQTQQIRRTTSDLRGVHGSLVSEYEARIARLQNEVAISQAALTREKAWFSNHKHYAPYAKTTSMGQEARLVEKTSPPQY